MVSIMDSLDELRQARIELDARIAIAEEAAEAATIVRYKEAAVRVVCDTCGGDGAMTIHEGCETCAANGWYWAIPWDGKRQYPIDAVRLDLRRDAIRATLDAEGFR